MEIRGGTGQEQLVIGVQHRLRPNLARNGVSSVIITRIVGIYTVIALYQEWVRVIY